MKDWRYLFAIRYYQKDLQYHFPNDKLGIGDRLILNRISVENTRRIIRNSKDNGISVIYRWTCVSEEMEEFGFKPRELEADGDRIIRSKNMKRVGGRI